MEKMIYKFNNEKELQEYIDENKLYWEIYELPEYPSEFIRMGKNDGIIITLDDAKQYYPEEYAEATGKSAYDNITPVYDGKEPQILNLERKVSCGTSGVYEMAFEYTSYDVLINGYMMKGLSIPFIDEDERLLPNFHEEFIRNVLMTTENLYSVLNYIDVTDDGYYMVCSEDDQYDNNTKTDIRKLLNDTSAYSKGTEYNSIIYEFIKSHWTDELYGFISEDMIL